MPPKKLLLHNRQAPGDILILTALVRDLHLQYPGQFVTDLHVHVKEDVWGHNPYITPLNPKDPDVSHINMRYGQQLLNGNKSGKHFLTAFHEYLNRYLNLQLKLSQLRPEVYFTDEERDTPLIEGDYWVMVAGGKSDMLAKIWEPDRWQRVVDLLHGAAKIVQCGGGPERKRPRHVHPALAGVTNMIGKTNFRDFMRVILHSQGVICGITVAMHLAGALNKPCVVLAGGREHYTWEAYTRETWQRSVGTEAPWDFVEHRFLHSIGELGCCLTGGCWKRGVGELGVKGQDDPNCRHLKEQPSGNKIPDCLDKITAERVVEEVLSYNTPQVMPVPKSEIATSSKKGFTMLETLGNATVCVLLYGNYEQLHRRVINSVIDNTPKEHYKFLVGCNEVCQSTLDWLPRRLEGVDHEIMIESTNIYKYPFMRNMFAKVSTDWIVWLDDDSHVSNPEWLRELAKHVYHGRKDRNLHCWGKKYFIHMKPGQEDWIKEAAWYRDKPLTLRKGQPIVNFMTGGFWAITTEAARAIDWPDPRIRHNGGDVMLGEALRQMDFGMQQVIIPGVAISDAKRRGHSEIHPGIGA